MTKSLTTCLALAALLAASIQVNAQGPIREGVRRTGEAAARGTRAAVQGTRDAIDRAGQATTNAIRGNSQYDNSQYAPSQDQAYDPAMDGSYESGYRGVDDQQYQGDQAQFNGPVYPLRYDAQGREFICLNGRRVYFDQQGSNQRDPQSREAYRMNNDQIKNDQMQQGNNNQDNSNSVPPAPPAAPQLENQGNNNQSNQSTRENQELRSDDAGVDADVNAPDADGAYAPNRNNDADDSGANLDSTTDANEAIIKDEGAAVNAAKERMIENE